MSTAATITVCGVAAVNFLARLSFGVVPPPRGTLYRQPGTIVSADERSTGRQLVLDRIGSHSLRSGGAMHLNVAGYDHDVIHKLGRWSSNPYLVYIKIHIGQLTDGVAQRMAAISLRFHLVG
jgi:hypothetical protein